MPVGPRLNRSSFVMLTDVWPTALALQRALDGQETMERLKLSGSEPVQVPSHSPPEYLWNAELGAYDIEFRLGVIASSKLPSAERHPTVVRAWPLAVWASISATPKERPAAAAAIMSVSAWGTATNGVGYDPELGAFVERSRQLRYVDFCIAFDLDLEDDYAKRYPDAPFGASPIPGGVNFITVKVHRGEPITARRRSR